MDVVCPACLFDTPKWMTCGGGGEENFVTRRKTLLSSRTFHIWKAVNENS